MCTICGRSTAADAVRIRIGFGAAVVRRAEKAEATAALRRASETTSEPAAGSRTPSRAPPVESRWTRLCATGLATPSEIGVGGAFSAAAGVGAAGAGGERRRGQ